MLVKVSSDKIQNICLIQNWLNERILKCD